MKETLVAVTSFLFGQVNEVCCGVRLLIWSPHALSAGSGFICSCCYWKWIPGAIWIQLIQLNAVNNWSDSETEPCHMGAVTSPCKGLKKYSCAAGLPRVVCSTISSLYLITACEGHRADHEDAEGEVTAALEPSARLCKDLQLQSLEAHGIITRYGLQTWAYTKLLQEEKKKKKKSGFHFTLHNLKLIIGEENKSVFVSFLTVFFLALVWSECELFCIACYKGHMHNVVRCMGRLSFWPWFKAQIGAIFVLGLERSLDCDI